MPITAHRASAGPSHGMQTSFLGLGAGQPLLCWCGQAAQAQVEVTPAVAEPVHDDGSRWSLLGNLHFARAAAPVADPYRIVCPQTDCNHAHVPAVMTIHAGPSDLVPRVLEPDQRDTDNPFLPEWTVRLQTTVKPAGFGAGRRPQDVRVSTRDSP